MAVDMLNGNVVENSYHCETGICSFRTDQSEIDDPKTTQRFDSIDQDHRVDFIIVPPELEQHTHNLRRTHVIIDHNDEFGVSVRLFLWGTYKKY